MIKLQFANIDDLVPVGSSVSKVTAQAPRNKFFFDAQSGQIREVSSLQQRPSCFAPYKG